MPPEAAVGSEGKGSCLESAQGLAKSSRTKKRSMRFCRVFTGWPLCKVCARGKALKSAEKPKKCHFSVSNYPHFERSDSVSPHTLRNNFMVHCAIVLGKVSESEVRAVVSKLLCSRAERTTDEASVRAG